MGIGSTAMNHVDRRDYASANRQVKGLGRLLKCEHGGYDWDRQGETDEQMASRLSRRVEVHLHDPRAVVRSLRRGYYEPAPGFSGYKGVGSALYLMATTEHWLKIGISKSPASRRGQVQGSCPLPVTLLQQWYLPHSEIGFIGEAAHLERALHKSLIDLRCERGAGQEWFRVDPIIIDLAVEQLRTREWL